MKTTEAAARFASLAGVPCAGSNMSCIIGDFQYFVSFEKNSLCVATSLINTSSELDLPYDMDMYDIMSGLKILSKSKINMYDVLFEGPVEELTETVVDDAFADVQALSSALTSKGYVSRIDLNRASEPQPQASAASFIPDEERPRKKENFFTGILSVIVVGIIAVLIMLFMYCADAYYYSLALITAICVPVLAPYAYEKFGNRISFPGLITSLTLSEVLLYLGNKFAVSVAIFFDSEWKEFVRVYDLSIWGVWEWVPDLVSEEYIKPAVYWCIPAVGAVTMIVAGFVYVKHLMGGNNRLPDLNAQNRKYGGNRR